METQIASIRHVAAAAVTIVVLLASACSAPSAPSSVPEVVSDPTSFTDSPAGTPTQFFSPLSTLTSTLAPQQDGWASITGFRNAETLVQKRIVQNAIAADGESSGQSIPGDWDTDAANGDGERMRTAINLLANSIALQPQDFGGLQPRDVIVIRSRIVPQMKALLTTFDARRQQILIDRMFDRFSFFSKLQGLRSFRFPLRDDRQLLSFLGINRQCLEWVNAIALTSGGRQLRWLSPGVPLYNSRPGMGLFDGDRAMIILDVDWRGGVPARFRVADANFGTDWINPIGQIPWQRTVIASRIIPAINKVVSFD